MPPPPYLSWFFRGLGDEPLLVQTFDAPRDPGWDVLDPMFVVAYLEGWLLDSEARATLYDVHATLFGAQSSSAWGLGEEHLSLRPLLLQAFERQDLIVLAQTRRNAQLPGQPTVPPPPPPPPPPLLQPLLLGDLGVLVVDQTTGKAVDGASLSVVGPESADETTGADGIFIFRDLLPGRYSITATKDRLGSTTGSATVIAGTSVSAPNRSVSAPRPLKARSGLVASASNGGASSGGAAAPSPPIGPGTTLFLASTPIDLTVEVRDDSALAEPIGGANVDLALLAGATAGRSFSDVTTGDAIFGGLSPDQYSISASKLGFTTETVSPFGLALGNQTVRIVLHGAMELGFTVLDGDGNPVFDASVDLLRNGGQIGHAGSDAQGQGTFKNLGPSTYQVFVRKIGFSDQISSPVTLVASSTAVKVRLRPTFTITSSTVATGPSNRARTRVGVGEGVILTMSPVSIGAVTWSVSGGGSVSPTTGASTTFIAGDRAATSTIVATTDDGASSTLIFGVIEPSAVVIQRIPGTGLFHLQGTAGAGFTGQAHVQPVDVSFENIEVRERDVPAVAVGYFAPENGQNHAANEDWVPTRPFVSGMGSKLAGVDRILGGDGGIGPPYSPGSFTWAIPWEYRVGKGASKVFATVF